jgi:hypothetical protein
MKRIVAILPFLIFNTALLAVAAPAQTKPATGSSQTQRSRAMSSPDAGKVAGNVYSSDYFGFSYTIPEGMAIDPDIAEGQKDASGRAVVLLALVGESEEEDADPTSALIILADRASDYDKLADGGDYLSKVANGIAQRQGFEVLQPGSELILAGRKFFRADYKKGNILQSAVFTLVRGYAVGFNVAAPSETERNRLIESLSGLKFTSRAN